MFHIIYHDIILVVMLTLFFLIFLLFFFLNLGVDASDVILANQGYGRSHMSNSVQLISQTSGPPGFKENKRTFMPHVHIPIAPDNTGESTVSSGIAQTTTASVTLVNGYISDSAPSYLPPSASSVINTRMMNARAYKHAQPTHTAPGRHQNVVNMPGLDLSQPLHSLNKNGNGLNQLIQSTLHPYHYMVPPPIQVTQGNSMPCHPTMPPVQTGNLAAPAANHNAQNPPAGGQLSMPPTMVSEAPGNMPMVQFLYIAPHPSLTGSMPPQPRGIVNTMANSTVVITTTQSHPGVAPPPAQPLAPPTSHSPSPVASIVPSDYITGVYVPEQQQVPVDPVRQDGSPTSPPGHNLANNSSAPAPAAVIPGKVIGGPNSATPSPPLPNKQNASNVTCESAAPPVYFPQHPYFLPFPAHNNGLVPQMPPHFPFPHTTANPSFPNGFSPDMYIHRLPNQLGGGQVPFHLYGNSIYHHPMHTANSSNTNNLPNTGNSSHTNSGYNTNAPTNNGKNGCYNCGHAGHKAVDCKENTMESMSSKWQLGMGTTLM